MSGEKIKKLREEAGMSQEALAERMGVTRQAVSKWEHDLSVPDMQNLLKLSALFGISMEEWTKKESAEEKCTEGDAQHMATEGFRSGNGQEAEPDGHGKKRPARRKLFLFLVAFICGVFLVVFIMVLMFAATTSTVERVSMSEEVFLIEEETESVLGAAENEAMPEQTDYLNSPDGVALQQTAQDFAKAYFQADRVTAGKYAVIEEENLEVWDQDIWDGLDHFVLKWNPEDLKDKERIGVSCEVRIEGEDSYIYLGLELLKIQGVWKVADVFVEK